MITIAVANQKGGVGKTTTAINIATAMAGQVTVAKVNIEDSPQTPSKYGVRGIPTLMLFRDGQVVSSKVGAMPRGKIEEWLREFVS